MAVEYGASAGYDESRMMFARHLRDAQQLTIVEAPGRVLGGVVLSGTPTWRADPIEREQAWDTPHRRCRLDVKDIG